MRPDRYSTRSPDNLDIYGEEYADTNVNNARFSRSPDSSIYAAEGANFAQASIQGEKVKGWFTNLLLAICICALLASFFMWRYGSMIQDLKRWDLDNFKQTEWTELKAQIKADHELIQSYGLQKTVRDTVKQTIEDKENGRPHHNP